MRVSQGGHDVPAEKLIDRYPRTLANLKDAICELPHVWIFDNDDLRQPFRKVVVCEHGRPTVTATPVPRWLRTVLKKASGS